ncbi:ankyrin [Dendrothele bispora CBS 962.96]|uniref:Ankyrin n=1 Tax=Dendrothele bispora (strain CBS 962.96) TaxID=1314807 RepID=A0A4S8MWH4_DENBC|nr:ankyrin [Dendrothele bispora CBS 962.96]
MDYTPSDDFHEAASYLSKASSLAKVSTSIKLELYGLFKWLTVHPAPDTSRPSIFDMTGRAKWDAWNTASQHYSNGAEVEKRYLEIARELGWSPGAAVGDNDEDPDSDSNKGPNVGGGMGHSVSVMSMNPDQLPDNTIHGLAITNDVANMKKLLLNNSQVDLNARDEFGYTCLHLAADRGNVEMVRLLVEHGVDLTAKDEDELTAGELARIAGHNDIVDILSNP